MRIAQKIRAGLACNHSVTEAIYNAGFNFNSRSHEGSSKMLDMTTSDYRAGAPPHRNPPSDCCIFARRNPGGAERTRRVCDPDGRRSE